MDLFGGVRECHVCLQFRLIPESIPAGAESPNESQRL